MLNPCLPKPPLTHTHTHTHTRISKCTNIAFAHGNQVVRLGQSTNTCRNTLGHTFPTTDLCVRYRREGINGTTINHDM
ncbi:hypothetical protein EYC80_001804 [Monilinia laxa]|uniref:Uncharacterized protein n=1 Tax=Monilinia laxa TaxID=61186 RepID=A0A5N6K694_MONLA|nr:hypothetical protein EYC80_001804 [Monilinia laxa]